MNVARTAAEMSAWAAVPDPRGTGFVPTMGYLHEGHASLVRRARAENGRVAASIFVNPSQFGRGEDLSAYPRDLERDLALLDSLGVDSVFIPEAPEVYPPGFQTWVEVTDVSAPLEGHVRPGHFRGVATVVLVLLNLLRPDRVYFGQKDAQQLAVIRRMCADLAVGVEVVACPTVREPDGLAMSSRNVYLSDVERTGAGVLYRALSTARSLWRSGATSADALRSEMRRVLDAEPLARTEYVSVADPDSMAELADARAGALLSMAVRVGPARLIDNLTLE